MATASGYGKLGSVRFSERVDGVLFGKPNEVAVFAIKFINNQFVTFLVLWHAPCKVRWPHNCGAAACRNPMPE